ncbi:hypothetical protein CQW23_07348 [Capsicum baccatum]|uniref:Uncharacterized protein n=1 Tax=Capsicum baccatum TaxID=33114 RepID=A0A2G2X5Y3_CAPBA|nr:hypothetical protein CQW23_07348 [Capsicum baccatum]
MNHVIDDLEVVEYKVSSDYLCGSVVDENSHAIDENSNMGESISTFHDINVEGLNEEPIQTDNLNVEVGVGDLSNLKETKRDLASADSQKLNILKDDESKIDEELKSLRNKNKKLSEKKKSVQNEKIKLETILELEMKELSGVYKNATKTNIDIGYKSRGRK